MPVSIDHQVIVSGVVTRSACILLDVILSSLIHLADNLLSLFATDAALLYQTVDTMVHRGLDENAQVVGMLTEDKESAAPCDDARLILCNALQNLRLRLEQVVGDQEVGHRRILRNDVWRRIAGHDFQATLEVCPPVVLLTFQPFYFFGAEVVFLLQGRNDSLVVKGHSQFLGQFLTDGPTAGAKLTVDSDYKFLVQIHIVLVDYLGKGTNK